MRYVVDNHGYKAYGIEMFRQDLIYYRSDNLTVVYLGRQAIPSAYGPV